MSLKEILFNIIIPLISGIIGGTISTIIIMQKNVKKNIIKIYYFILCNGVIIIGYKN